MTPLFPHWLLGNIVSLTARESVKVTQCLIIFIVGKESACSAGDLSSIPGLGISSREENGNPLQYSCLEHSMDRRAWQATVHGVARIRHDLATIPPPSTLFIGRDKDDIGEVWQGILQGVSKMWQKKIPTTDFLAELDFMSNWESIPVWG